MTQIESKEPKPLPIIGPDAASWNTLGFAFATAYWRQDAIEKFNAIAPLDIPESAAAWFSLAAMYYEEKNLLKLAESAIHNAVLRAPDNDYYRGYLGHLKSPQDS